MKMHTTTAWVGALAVLLLTSCGMSRRAQLHRVAKDWCETIRASQVIAVYPLTQDVQPGDVFLVQTPIDKQQDIYKSDGFLPLDNHLARLDPEGYPEFYRKSFLAADPNTPLPANWLKEKWKSAPSAAFPSYAFSASKGGGLNLAIPVSGVPVGLSLLGTQSATGTISLKDARTVGVDTESLYKQLQDWAHDPNASERQELLSGFGVRAGEAPRNYLRVITRVYLLGAIDVQLNDARSFGAGADVGAARPIELFVPDVPEGPDDVRRAGQETYLRGVQRLNSMTGTGVPESTEGADPTLSSTEFAEREKARAEAREAEVETAQQNRKTAGTELEAAKKAADDSAEGQALKTAATNLEDAQKTEQEKQEALEQARAEDPPNEQKIKEAEEALAAAQKDVEIKEKSYNDAKKAYGDKHGASIQQAAGKLDVADAALQRLEQFAPGGSFRFNAASARSVSMTETFDVPLVVGYLGFDVPIGVGGELGYPIPTHARLKSGAGAVVFAMTPALDVYTTAANQNLYDALAELAKQGNKDAVRTKKSLESMVRFMNASKPQIRTSQDGTQTFTFVDHTASAKTFGGYLTYRDERETAIVNLKEAADAGKTVKVDGADTTGDELRRLAERLSETPKEDNAYRAAVKRLREFWARQPVR